MTDTQAAVSPSDKRQQGRIKAFILSAAIFPGLGQLSQKRYVMAALLASSSALCLYIVVSEMLVEINLAAGRILASGSMDMNRVHAEAQDIVMKLDTPMFLIAAYGLIVIWLFAAVEVFRPVLKR